MMAYAQTGGPERQEPAGYGGSVPPPPPRGPDKPRSNTILIAGLLVLGIVMLVGLVAVIVAVAGMAGGADGFDRTGEKVGVITVEGVISASGNAGMLGVPLGGVRQTLEQLRRAQEDDSVKAVVLRINSPGGSAAASQELYHEIKRLADAKPLVVSMADAAASGGYYIALPAQKIVANQATMTGSIGVRMSFLRYYELMDEIGVEGGDITSGPLKDIGSPWKAMTAKERALLQSMIDNIYEQFVEHVAESRGMEIEEAKAVADGRIFTGQQALEAGLVDELGGFNRAVEIAGELGGIEGEPAIHDIRSRGGIFDLIGVQSRALAREAARGAVTDVLRDVRVEDAESLLQMAR